jgi:hypothetical protein
MERNRRGQVSFEHTSGGRLCPLVSRARMPPIGGGHKLDGEARTPFSAASAVKPGFLASWRRASFRSFMLCQSCGPASADARNVPTITRIVSDLESNAYDMDATRNGGALAHPWDQAFPLAGKPALGVRDASAAPYTHLVRAIGTRAAKGVAHRAIARFPHASRPEGPQEPSPNAV